jgi:hypothetical protein
MKANRIENLLPDLAPGLTGLSEIAMQSGVVFVRADINQTSYLRIIGKSKDPLYRNSPRKDECSGYCNQYVGHIWTLIMPYRKRYFSLCSWF